MDGAAAQGSPLLEADQDRHLRYSRASVEVCQQAVKAVGVKIVSGVNVPPGSAYRDAFLTDLAAARRPLVEEATRTTLKLQATPGEMQSVSDPHWMVVGLASLHDRVVDFAFVCARVGGSTADIHGLYGGSLDPAAAAGVRARLNEFNKAFFAGSLDVALVESYYQKMNGPRPQPNFAVDFFALYVYVLAHGGYYALPFDSVWVKLGSNPNTNPTYLRALYRACLYPYEKKHAGEPMFFAVPSAPGTNVVSMQSYTAGPQATAPQGAAPMVAKDRVNAGSVAVQANTSAMGQRAPASAVLDRSKNPNGPAVAANSMAGRAPQPTFVAPASRPHANHPPAKKLAMNTAAPGSVTSKGSTSLKNPASNPAPGNSQSPNPELASPTHANGAPANSMQMNPGLPANALGIITPPSASNTVAVTSQGRSAMSIQQVRGSQVTHIPAPNSSRALRPPKMPSTSLVIMPGQAPATLSPATHSLPMPAAPAPSNLPPAAPASRYLPPASPAPTTAPATAPLPKNVPAPTHVPPVSRAQQPLKGARPALDLRGHLDPSVAAMVQQLASSVVAKAAAEATQRGLAVDAAFQSDIFFRATNLISVVCARAGQHSLKNMSPELLSQAVAAAGKEASRRIDFLIVQRKTRAASARKSAGGEYVHLSHRELAGQSPVQVSVSGASQAPVQTPNSKKQPPQVASAVVPAAAAPVATTPTAAGLSDSMSPEAREEGRAALKQFQQLQFVIQHQSEVARQASMSNNTKMAVEAARIVAEASEVCRQLEVSANHRVNASARQEAEKQRKQKVVTESKTQAESEATALALMQAAVADLGHVDADMHDKSCALENSDLSKANGDKSGSSATGGRTGNGGGQPAEGDADETVVDNATGMEDIAKKNAPAGALATPSAPPFSDNDRSSSFVSALLTKISEQEAGSADEATSSAQRATHAAHAAHAASAVGTTFVCSTKQKGEVVVMPSPGLTLSKLKADFSTDLKNHLEKTHGAERLVHVTMTVVDLFDLLVCVLRMGGMREVLKREQVSFLADEIGGSRIIHPDVLVATYIWLLGTYEVRFLAHTRRNPPLLEAATSGDVARVSVLLSQGAAIDYVDSFGNSSLHAAAHIGCVLLAEHLLVRGATIDIYNKSRVTPLALAAARGHASLVDLLLECGADPSVVSNEGKTALFYGVAKRRTEVVRVMLAAGVSASAAVHPEAQMTGLHLAAACGDVEILRMLIDAGADLDGGDRLNRTALHFAAFFDAKLAAVELLRAGSDPRKLSGRQQTPADVAKSQGNHGLSAFVHNIGEIMGHR